MYCRRSIAVRVGCDPDGSSKEIKECLLKAKEEDIVEQSNIDTNIQEFIPLHFVPVVDGPGEFLPKSPLEMLESGEFIQVPTIIGYNKDEGLLIVWRHLIIQGELKRLNNNMMEHILSLAMGRGDRSDINDDQINLAREIIAKDFNGEVIQSTSLEGPLRNLLDLISDAWFNAIGMKTAQMMAAKSTAPVYEYLYQHMGTTSFLDFQMNPPWKVLARAVGRKIGLDLFYERLGCSHADEVFMLFKSHGLPYDSVFSEDDANASINMVELWTNFAKTVGNPTPEDVKGEGVLWRRMDPQNPQRMNISSTLSFGPRGKEESARLERWEKIWDRFPPGVYEKKQKSWAEMANKYSMPETDSDKEEL